MNREDKTSAGLALPRWLRRGARRAGDGAPLHFASVLGCAHFGHLLLLAMALLAWPFAELGLPRALPQWRWMDIVGEGGATLMVGIWLGYVRAARPAGLVTNWLSLGLAGMALGGWVDLLDEFWLLPKAMVWDNWLESTLMPLGMLVLTVGLHLWRREQLALNRQLRQHERVFRDHRRIDTLTQLADADYMAAQIALERREGRRGALLMFGWAGVDALAREQGLAAADRLVQAAALLLQLHLPADALLCRYAGDRLLVLLPGCSSEGAASPLQHQQQLRAALDLWRYELPDGERLALPVLSAMAATDELNGPPQALLLRLLERLA
jgi:GGDEF domain-containing protein